MSTGWLRKWTRLDRIALSELMDAYAETGRDRLRPIPLPVGSKDLTSKPVIIEDEAGGLERPYVIK